MGRRGGKAISALFPLRSRGRLTPETFIIRPDEGPNAPDATPPMGKYSRNCNRAGRTHISGPCSLFLPFDREGIGCGLIPCLYSA